MRIAAINVGRTDTAFGAFSIGGSGPASGRPKRSPLRRADIAVLFYNTMRFGMKYADPGADYYEANYRSGGS